MESEWQSWWPLVAGRLRAARLAAGLSVRDAREASGVSLSTIQRAESPTATHGPPLAVLARLASAYGVQPAELLPPIPDHPSAD